MNISLDFGHNLLAKSVFEQVLAVVSAPGYRLLHHFRSDLLSDGKMLRHHYGPQSRALLIVRDCGTDLCFLGSTPSDNDWARAMLSNRKREGLPVDCFLLQSGQVRSSSLDEGLSLLQTLKTYTASANKVLSPQGDHFANYSVRRDMRPMDAALRACVRFESLNNHSLGLAQLRALRRIAYGLANAEFSSLFASLSSLTLDGQCLHDLIEEREQSQARLAA